MINSKADITIDLTLFNDFVDKHGRLIIKPRVIQQMSHSFSNGYLPIKRRILGTPSQLPNFIRYDLKPLAEIIDDEQIKLFSENVSGIMVDGNPELITNIKELFQYEMNSGIILYGNRKKENLPLALIKIYKS